MYYNMQATKFGSDVLTRTKDLLSSIIDKDTPSAVSLDALV